MKVVGLSGAQGGGKSSLLIELQARGWRLDQFRVSRAVQAQLGWETLDNVMSSPQTMMEFQEEVFRQKYNHDLTLSVQLEHEFEPVSRENIFAIANPEHLQRNSIVLTERTFADIWAYTSLWTWKFHEQGKLTFDESLKFLTSYTKKCADAQNLIYSAVMILPYMPDVVAWVNDPNRAKREDVDTVFEDVERFVERKQPIGSKKLRINTKSVSERADQVETFLRSL